MISFEYPLKWLPQQARTRFPESARFGLHSLHKAGTYLVNELGMLGASKCVITSNLQTKVAGGFYANQKVEDSGVVIYFELKGVGKAMACDKWKKPEHNLWALYLSVSAIRGLERWGGSEFLDGLFTGFKALPYMEGQSTITPQKNYFEGYYEMDEIKNKYKILAKELHPDTGGDENEFQLMSQQFESIKKQRGENS